MDTFELMKRSSTAFAFTGLAMIGTGFGAVIGQSSPPQINGNWLIDLRTVIAVAAVVLPATFTLAVIFTKFSTRLMALEKQSAARDATMQDLLRRFGSLPCSDCPPKGHHRH